MTFSEFKRALDHELGFADGADLTVLKAMHRGARGLAADMQQAYVDANIATLKKINREGVELALLEVDRNLRSARLTPGEAARARAEIRASLLDA